KFGHLGIPNLIRILAIFRLLTWILTIASGREFASALQFDRTLILQGEIWRFLSFALSPLDSSPIFVLIEVMFMFMISDGIEQSWGAFGVTVFVFATILLQAIAGLVTPLVSPIGGGFIFQALIVAFACLYPN